MRCPWCGNPAATHGDWWECYYCGDSGNLRRTPVQQPAQITLTLSFVYHVDLPETWNDLKKELNQIAPKNALLSQLLGKVLLHHISVGIHHAETLPDEKKAEELRTFLTTTADLNLGESTEEIMRDARCGVLFCEEAALSETDCGTFWTELLSMRPVEDYYNHVDPDGLVDLLSELSSAYAYFGGKKDEEMGEAQDHQNALEEAYNTHWQNKVLLHPDAERAKRLLAQGKFPDYEDICREVLLVEYPEEVPHESAQDFDDLSWDYILDDVFASNTAKGIQMWRRLLDITEPSLKTDAKTAEKLLPDWDWLDSPSHDQVLLLLTALDDERFASQLFESAYIGRLQLDVLNACRSCGQEELGQHCLELALKNPCLEENWEKRLRRVFTTAPSSGRSKLRSYPAKPIADTKPDDGTVYHYCSVQVQGTRRPYAYLTGGLPLKVGDWVELPFGKDDVLRQGQVKAVMDCTRMVAPWPPEQTKTVVRTIDAPAVTPTTEVAAPESQKRVEQPKKKTESVEIPVISAPETKTEESKAEPQVIEPVVSDKENPVLSKKPFPLGKLIAAVLAVALIAGISISVSIRNKQRAAAYDAALQELSDGNYATAEQDFADLSGYRDAASLSVYCKYAGMYKDRTDYAGGQDELSNIMLQYDTSWQQDVDALETRVKGYKAEKDAAEEAERKRIAAENAAKQEQSRKDQYSGKLPVEGMPMSCLKYTSLGSPDKTEKCRGFDNLVEEKRSYTVYWYDSEGRIQAAGHCFKGKHYEEYMLISFSYYDYSISNSFGHNSTSDNSSDNGGLSVRNDYDNPEDLWEDNQDWYEDEDEAWDEWYDG